MKVCTKCKESKELEEFHKDKTKRDGKAPRCKACINASKNAQNATPEGRAKKNATEKSRRENLTPGEIAKRKVAGKARYANLTIENKEKENTRAKSRYEAQKQERMTYLMENFDKLESEVSGTIYHFEINGVYKIGKTLYGFDNRYYKHVQKKATQITEWVMNEEQMDAFEKIILEKTKEFQYVGDDVLPCTGNREIRTNDNEQLIDDLLAELKVNFVKLKR